MRTTLITGANRGLGFEFARQYLANGGMPASLVGGQCTRRKPGACWRLRYVFDQGAWEKTQK
jgi:NAD(P)-dependent dehydrogenase (short-subunit alcohol dehydrogenase family)